MSCCYRHNGGTVSFGKGANQSTKLQKLDLKYISHLKTLLTHFKHLCSSFLPQSECVRDFGQLGIEVGTTSVCAVSRAGDTCAGDSGSGLVRARGDSRELVGLVSYGVGCDSSVNGEWCVPRAFNSWLLFRKEVVWCVCPGLRGSRLDQGICHWRPVLHVIIHLYSLCFKVFNFE